MSVEFVDELPSPRRTGKSGYRLLAAFADVLRSNPGKWAKHPTAWKTAMSASSAAYVIRAGKSSSFTSGDFDADARGDVVYVRYVGGVA